MAYNAHYSEQNLEQDRSLEYVAGRFRYHFVDRMCGNPFFIIERRVVGDGEFYRGRPRTLFDFSIVKIV